METHPEYEGYAFARALIKPGPPFCRPRGMWEQQLCRTPLVWEGGEIGGGALLESFSYAAPLYLCVWVALSSSALKHLHSSTLISEN